MRSGLKWHIEADGLNRYIDNITSKGRTIHILLKGTLDIPQNRHILDHKTSLNTFRKIQIKSSSFSDDN